MEQESKADLLYPDQREVHDAIVSYYLDMATAPVFERDPFDREENVEEDVLGGFFEEPVEDTKPDEGPWQKKLLIGYAGTGKTTTVAAIVETIVKKFKGNVIISAPTHKAVRVAKNKSNIRDADFVTIQKVLGVKPKKNYHTGEVEYEPDYNAPVAMSRKTLLIVDEVSMMNTNLFEYLVKAKRHFPVLFVGDSVQIPPVDSGKKKELSDSAVFIDSIRKEHLIEVHELTQVRRQAAGNPIIQLATYIRTNYKRTIPLTNYVDGIKRLNKPELLSCSQSNEGGGEIDKELITKWYTSDEYQEDLDYCRVVAWRNETVRTYNKSIRTILYGDAAQEQYVEGERIIFEEPYSVKEFGRNVFLALNSEEFEVIDVSRSSLTIEIPYVKSNGIKYENTTIPVFILKCKSMDDDDQKVITVRVPVDREAYKAILEDLGKRAKACYDKEGRKELYRYMFDLQERVAWINYGYAITAHKSQGSTYKKVLVALWDIDKNFRTEEKNRINYVAVTRAAETLHVSV